jgi:rod shape-determining protein MreC
LFFAFVVLEALSLVLISNTSYFGRSTLMAKADAIKGIVDKYASGMGEYFSLKSANDALTKENAELRNRLDKLLTITALDNDTIPASPYRSHIFLPALVMENSLNRWDNYMILNKGRKQGVSVDMGVIAPDGIAGTVYRVSDNFCTVMSLLNTRRKLDAKLKKTGHHGPLEWNGKDIRRVDLTNIPAHIDVAIGDSVITGGHSLIFPEGIFIGTISEYKIDKGAHYRISVELATDFQSLRQVYVIGSLRKPELDSFKIASGY